MVSIEDLISANTPLHKLNYTNKRYALSRLIGLKRVTHFRQSRGYLQRSQFLPIEAAARRVDNRQVTQGSPELPRHPRTRFIAGRSSCEAKPSAEPQVACRRLPATESC